MKARKGQLNGHLPLITILVWSESFGQKSIFLKSNFEININSQEVIKKCTRKSFTQPSPMLISYITGVQYQQQEDVSTNYKAYSNFTSYTCTHLCMCIALCYFITCRASCNYHRTQDTQLYYYHNIPLCYPFIAISTSHLPSLIPGNH